MPKQFLINALWALLGLSGASLVVAAVLLAPDDVDGAPTGALQWQRGYDDGRQAMSDSMTDAYLAGLAEGQRQGCTAGARP